MQRGFQSAGLGRPRGRKRDPQAKVQERGSLCRAVEPGRCRGREEAVNKAAQAPLVPREGARAMDWVSPG